MKQNRIKYIAAFDTGENQSENRSNVLSSANKINYIIDTLNRIGYEVDVISTSQTLNKHCYKGKKLQWGKNTIKYFPTTWRGGFLLKVLNLLVMNLSMLGYLLFNIGKNDKVIIYHSYGTMWMYPLLKFKRTKLYLECEEIYGDIFGNKCMSWLEKKMLKYADAYIYPTYLLDQVINHTNKPYLVVHGAYKDIGNKLFSDSNVETIVFDPDKYHVAYTGILDPKKGCIDVIQATRYLDSSYHIHILGFGSEDQLNLVRQTIDEVRKFTSCRVSYDGVRKGNDYSRYLSKINLGICTLDYNQCFVNTQFPSKIISYMAAGTPVLCSEAQAIVTCDVSNGIMFYKGTDSQSIAAGIKSARQNTFYNTKELLRDCDLKFYNQLSEILK